jgi:outer membrane protein assembly factor BamB
MGRVQPFAELRAIDPEQVGPYRLVARLGSGGMGSVYLGRSPSGRTVAVKVVRPDLAEEPGFRRRFAREVAAARRVNGAFTAGVVDADPAGSPPWLATEYVRGMALGAAVEAYGPWPVHHVLWLGAGLAEALNRIHAVGVVHRDLKPSNILLAQDGPRVIDFGISAVSEATALTQTGTMVGTPGYMSPEQLTGPRADPAADVFSLGAVLVYAATGAAPFGTGASHAVAYRTVHEPPALERVPPALRGVVEACLEKDPGRRPTAARLMAELLSGAEGGHVAAFPVDGGWLPQAVARMVPQAGSTPPAFDPAEPTSGFGPWEPTPGADGAAVPGPGTTARGEPAAGRATGTTRRRALLGLAGAAAVAGIGAGGRLSGIGRGGAASAASRSAGTLRWKSYAVADADDETSDNEAATLTVVHGLLHVAGSRALHALSVDSGAKKWTYTPGHKRKSINPAVVAAGDTVYLGVDGTVHALRAATGTKRWVQSTAGDYASPTVRGEALYTVSTAEGDESKGRAWLYAASAKTGAEKWSRESEQDRSSVTAAGDSLYTSTDGVLLALRPGTGDTRWQCDTGADSLGAATVDGGTVYVSGVAPNLTDSILYAVSAATGRKLWDTRGSGTFFSPPTAAGDTVLVSEMSGTERNLLRALDAKSGKVIWKRDLATDYLTGSVVADGTVYVVGDGVLHALRADTGGTVWQYATRTAVHATPLIAGDTVYLSTSTGKVYAIWI